MKDSHFGLYSILILDIFFSLFQNGCSGSSQTTSAKEVSCQPLEAGECADTLTENCCNLCMASPVQKLIDIDSAILILPSTGHSPASPVRLSPDLSPASPVRHLTGLGPAGLDPQSTDQDLVRSVRQSTDFNSTTPVHQTIGDGNECFDAMNKNSGDASVIISTQTHQFNVTQCSQLYARTSKDFNDATSDLCGTIVKECHSDVPNHSEVIAILPLISNSDEHQNVFNIDISLMPVGTIVEISRKNSNLPESTETSVIDRIVSDKNCFSRNDEDAVGPMTDIEDCEGDAVARVKQLADIAEVEVDQQQLNVDIDLSFQTNSSDLDNNECLGGSTVPHSSDDAPSSQKIDLSEYLEKFFERREDENPCLKRNGTNLSSEVSSTLIESDEREEPWMGDLYEEARAEEAEEQEKVAASAMTKGRGNDGKSEKATKNDDDLDTPHRSDVDDEETSEVGVDGVKQGVKESDPIAVMPMEKMDLRSFQPNSETCLVVENSSASSLSDVISETRSLLMAAESDGSNCGNFDHKPDIQSDCLPYDTEGVADSIRQTGDHIGREVHQECFQPKFEEPVQYTALSSCFDGGGCLRYYERNENSTGSLKCESSNCSESCYHLSRRTGIREAEKFGDSWHAPPHDSQGVFEFPPLRYQSGDGTRFPSYAGVNEYTCGMQHRTSSPHGFTLLTPSPTNSTLSAVASPLSPCSGVHGIYCASPPRASSPSQHGVNRQVPTHSSFRPHPYPNHKSSLLRLQHMVEFGSLTPPLRSEQLAPTRWRGQMRSIDFPADTPSPTYMGPPADVAHARNRTIASPPISRASPDGHISSFGPPSVSSSFHGSSGFQYVPQNACLPMRPSLDIASSYMQTPVGGYPGMLTPPPSSQRYDFSGGAWHPNASTNAAALPQYSQFSPSLAAVHGRDAETVYQHHSSVSFTSPVPLSFSHSSTDLSATQQRPPSFDARDGSYLRQSSPVLDAHMYQTNIASYQQMPARATEFGVRSYSHSVIPCASGQWQY